MFIDQLKCPVCPSYEQMKWNSQLETKNELKIPSLKHPMTNWKKNEMVRNQKIKDVTQNKFGVRNNP
jgi:glutathione peroxidase-family protein